MAEIATFYDYFMLQGGKPNTWQDNNGLWHIRHEYRKDSPEIVTHISPIERGTVVLGDGKIYKVGFLWEFEGKPCESESLKNGGRRYERKL